MFNKKMKIMKAKYIFFSLCLFSFNSLLFAQTDMTNKIINPGFEDNVNDLATGWDYEGGCDAYAWHTINTDADDTKTGENICGLWNATFGDAAISQTISGLANGTYKVTADLMGSSNAASSRLTTQRIFGNNCSVLFGAESDYSAETVSVLKSKLGEKLSYAGHVVTQDDRGPLLKCEVICEVTDGTLTLGVKTNGSDSQYAFSFPNLTAGDGWGWFKVDNFTLTYNPATGISNASLKKNIKVRVNDGFVIVEGAESFEIHDLYGRFIPTNMQLNRGIYLVKANSQVVKVNVK
jgi:hypothetical protein